MHKTRPDSWLWGVALTALCIGVAVFILLGPAAETNLQVQQYRSLSLIGAIFISGLCIIIGTRNHWFGKGL